jgi:hypothetical protein
VARAERAHLIPTAVPPRVIINPQSFRASRRDLAQRVAAAAQSHGLEVLRASTPAEFRRTLDQLRAQQVQQIWMLAGDGTVLATAQYLAAPANAGWSPALLLLAGGRANIVPRDTGGYPAWPRFSAALQALREGRGFSEEQILTLRVDQDGTATRFGFFLTGAVIHAGVKLCQQHRDSGSTWLHRSWLADPYVLARTALQVWVGRSPLPSYDDMSVRAVDAAGSAVEMRAPMRLVLASTLAMREALYNPFASRGEGAVRVTAVAASAEGFWRRLPRMFKGHFGDDMGVQQGYLSGRFPAVEIFGMDGYALDGELFDVDPARPVRLSAGFALRVLRP